MAKPTEINDSKSVDTLIQKLEPSFATLIQAIRQTILETNTSISEHIKWNSPSFFYNGEMKPFNPKEYKRDIVVVNTRKSEALLVFPTGNVINSKFKLLQGDYSDGRKIIKFKSFEEFERSKA